MIATYEEYCERIVELERRRNARIAAMTPQGKHPYEDGGYDRIRAIDRETAAESEILFWEAAQAGVPRMQWAVARVGGLEKIPTPEQVRLEHHAAGI
jgi:hypothetical protein